MNAYSDTNNNTGPDLSDRNASLPAGSNTEDRYGHNLIPPTQDHQVNGLHANGLSAQNSEPNATVGTIAYLQHALPEAQGVQKIPLIVDYNQDSLIPGNVQPPNNNSSNDTQGNNHTVHIDETHINHEEAKDSDSDDDPNGFTKEKASDESSADAIKDLNLPEKDLAYFSEDKGYPYISISKANQQCNYLLHAQLDFINKKVTKSKVDEIYEQGLYGTTRNTQLFYDRFIKTVQDKLKEIYECIPKKPMMAIVSGNLEKVDAGEDVYKNVVKIIPNDVILTTTHTSRVMSMIFGADKLIQNQKMLLVCLADASLEIIIKSEEARKDGGIWDKNYSNVIRNNLGERQQSAWIKEGDCIIQGNHLLCIHRDKSYFEKLLV
jgi:hypothetical protein